MSSRCNTKTSTGSNIQSKREYQLIQIFNARIRSCGKVLFSHMFVHRGGSWKAALPPQKADLSSGQFVHFFQENTEGNISKYLLFLWVITMFLWPNFCDYTGSRLERVRLLWAPSYNEQIFFSKTNLSHLRQCLKSSDTTSTSYNEHIFMN